ncbi:MAG: septation protein IspZ [Proteobacteria bacterium]|nr:septation protein IspZ [Pseudomonadota bacterium]
MQTIAELAPLVAFFITYRVRGLYAATAVLMVAMALVLAFDWLRLRRIPPLHALSALLVLLFGSATLLLHDRAFIQWKPTVLLWGMGLAFMASGWFGRHTLTQRLLGPAVREHFTIGERLWRRLNAASVAFYLAAGAANLAVARNFAESTWVNFKVFALPALAFVFTALQAWWLTRHASASPVAATNGEATP